MRNGSIQMFEDYLDILIYVAHADHEVGAKELEEEVTEFSRGQLNVHLKRLAKADYLVSNNKKNSRAYTATDKTKQLFGVKA